MSEAAVNPMEQGVQPKLQPIQAIGSRNKPWMQMPDGSMAMTVFNLVSSFDAQTAALIVGSVTVTAGTEATDKIRVRVHVLDANGKDIANIHLIEAWLSDSATGWETSTGATSLTVVTGVAADVPTATKRLRMLTNATGTAQFDVEYTGGAITWYVRVCVQGIVYTQAITFA